MTGRPWLGASEMGADLYRRIGFSDLGTRIVEYESPRGAGEPLRAVELEG